MRLSESIDPVGDAIPQWARNTIRMQASRVCCTRVCSKHFEAPTYPRRYTGDYNSRRTPGAPHLVLSIRSLCESPRIVIFLHCVKVCRSQLQLFEYSAVRVHQFLSDSPAHDRWRRSSPAAGHGQRRRWCRLQRVQQRCRLRQTCWSGAS